MKQYVSGLATSLVVATLLAVNGNTALAQRPSGTAVTVWEIREGDFVDQISALGSLRAWESVVVTSTVAERVESVHFEDGDRVEAGAKLVTLRQAEEQAALREQQELLADAEREVRRLADLAKRNQVATGCQ